MKSTIQNLTSPITFFKGTSINKKTNDSRNMHRPSPVVEMGQGYDPVMEMFKLCCPCFFGTSSQEENATAKTTAVSTAVFTKPAKLSLERVDEEAIRLLDKTTQEIYTSLTLDEQKEVWDLVKNPSFFKDNLKTAVNELNNRKTSLYYMG